MTALLAAVFALPGSDAPASPDPASFNPSFAISLSDSSAGADATAVLRTSWPAGNHLPGNVFFAVPKGWGLAGGAAIADGDVIGSLSLSADAGCNGSVEGPVTANLVDVTDAEYHAHWNATLGAPFNLPLQILVDVNVDDPDVDWDVSLALWPNNPNAACNPTTFIVTINALSGQGTPVLTNPNPSRTYTWEAIYLSSPTSQLEHIVSRFAPVCIGLADGDADGVCNSDDNCDNWPNPAQIPPPWFIPPNDPDCDGFSSTVENPAGTYALIQCGFNAWPVDVNNDTFVDVIGDISELTANFSMSVPPAPARHDISPDPPNGFVDIFDITEMTAFFSLTCAPCPGDSDCDVVPNLTDNCPNWPNPAQLLPPWFVPANDPDCDGFSGTVETPAGTDPLAHCGVEAWPADINNDTFSDIFDITELTANFSLSVPPAPARHNISPDPPDGFVDIFDITEMTAFFSLSCS